MSAELKVGLLGHGTVGAAFAELLMERAPEVERLTGRRPALSGILTRSQGSFEEILERSQVIVELIGGVEPARDWVSRSLAAGRHVICANKQLLSQHGEELWDLAREHQVQLGFEAAVAGVVPVIRVLRESLAGAEIERIHGIVNGTTNFILSEMTRRSLSYAEALAEAQALGYAEADPADDVGGRDAAAKMAILARLAFNRPMRLEDVRYEGIEQLSADDIQYARELGLGLKLIGTAERLSGGLSVRVHPAFLYGGHPLASVEGPFNAVTVESEAITEITMSGPGAGGSQTASAVLGDLVAAIVSPRPPPPVASTELPLLPDVPSAFYIHMEVADRPGVLGQVAQVLGLQGASIKSVVQRGLGDNARLVMVTHPLLESRLLTALKLIGGLDFMRAQPRAIRVIEEQFGVSQGLIARYGERLPFSQDDPIITLGEGSTPLVLAEAISERVGAEVWLKLEGTNPTGSFKDRGMTCAVSAAVREGSEAVICASTGNTAASAAAYAAKADLRCAVIVPDGKIATGKLAQALMHGARVIALRGNFDEALALVRKLSDRHPISLVNSVNEFRLQGQKTAAFELLEDLDGRLDALCIPVGNAGNISAYWTGFEESGTAPRMFGFQAEGSAPLVDGAPVAHPETVASAIRIGNPARWEQALNAAVASRGAIRAVSDQEILAAYRLLASGEGVFCEPASAASVAGLLKYGADGAERVACVLTGHGLKDPQTALEQAGAVVPCEPELAAIEHAVLG